jgi:uncharacterized protein YciI
VKYFAAFLPMFDKEKSHSLRPLHLDHLASAFQQGRIFAYGRFADGAGGLIIYKASTLEEATQLAQGDPYVANGARGLEIHEWEMVYEKE